MVVYKCEVCSQFFNKKDNYDRHMKRKTPCYPGCKINNKSKIFSCNICKKKFNRKDNCDRHIKNCENLPSKNNNNNNNNKGEIVAVNGDRNNINSGNVTIHYNLFPFAQDGVDCLTTSEKIAIFTSEKNPCEMIIIKVNLDPLKLNHHNVGIPDLHRGYGMIYNGNEWITEKITSILEILLNSKEKDLLNIHDEIKDFVSEDINNVIKNKISKLNNTLRPRNPIEIKSKNILTTHLKKYFYNNRNLALEAQKHTQPINKICNDDINDYEGILKDGITIDEMDIQLKSRKHRTNILKEICYDLLNKSVEKNNIDNYNLELIELRIKTINDTNILNAIVNTLFTSAYLETIMTDEIVNNKIIKINEMNVFNF